MQALKSAFVFSFFYTRACFANEILLLPYRHDGCLKLRPLHGLARAARGVRRLEEQLELVELPPRDRPQLAPLRRPAGLDRARRRRLPRRPGGARGGRPGRHGGGRAASAVAACGVSGDDGRHRDGGHPAPLAAECERRSQPYVPAGRAAVHRGRR